jgi:hypothetical protein
MLPVVVGAKASKSIPEKSKGIDVVEVDDDVVTAFGSITVVTSGTAGTSVVVDGVVVVDVVVVDVLVVVVDVVVVVVVVAGKRSGWLTT